MGRELKITVNLSSHFIDFWQISFYLYQLSFRLLSFDKRCTQLITSEDFRMSDSFIWPRSRSSFSEQVAGFYDENVFSFLFSIFIFFLRQFWVWILSSRNAEMRKRGPGLIDLLNHCIDIVYPRTEFFIMDSKQLSKFQLNWIVKNCYGYSQNWNQRTSTMIYPRNFLHEIKFKSNMARYRLFPSSGE